ncbi:hypothetical protein UUR10_0151 [Ureaplasma urealyticum serovar 10 str. ATCC 33699]|uniref:Uncharacterized protein n=3 Tax=Ureaplasma urealyticum TaxID=2130 RepID=A0AAX1QYV5_UREUR|nr:hypothetical protein UUR10_0151 [Ureaplasma urealyticum serovar 10 str. ATCC 33699]EDT49777.1 hypothetical protein UUR13_0359 [Ureaplasma urealyticum serovar 13 str. ATCC 33698]EDU06328.1 hypothetical protein UUR5_G0175 [Ureaplasma urealyticum serovar 5 str. ATCC 27817]EDU56895.1 hypothetical protein UUR7_0155 [Ureaplasma urealyticum serovar 7 str. ATCC 27819]EDU66972.1 hypothetical protein UUR11_0150 [Ureaplasma urealyticum serovar 11 str. ATCC 33695]EDX53801.1 hypothetical protein UUR9_05
MYSRLLSNILFVGFHTNHNTNEKTTHIAITWAINTHTFGKSVLMISAGFNSGISPVHEANIGMNITDKERTDSVATKCFLFNFITLLP